MSYTRSDSAARTVAAMKLLHDPAPAGFEGITRAFAMARELPTTHRLALKIGVSCDGVLVAEGELDGYRQVRFFSDHLRSLGCDEFLLGGDEEMFGCDMLFSVLPMATEAEDDDPSFIRRPARSLWPEQS
ncbi:hypothetical protein HHL11_07220 [Ramlibacter sp. G-1-2-2]|uniref:Uncharacterized protein n=2 Tax=Ramlibacter agri TaxID=2728837 RepID=A0A848H4H6_9BURK|nr:hypothetical protein [Ramlibacter agri]